MEAYQVHSKGGVLVRVESSLLEFSHLQFSSRFTKTVTTRQIGCARSSYEDDVNIRRLATCKQASACL